MTKPIQRISELNISDMPRMSLEQIDDEELYYEELRQAQEAGKVISISLDDYTCLLKASKKYYQQKLSEIRKAQRERKRVRRQRRARQRKHNRGRI